MTPAERNAALAEADEMCWNASDAARKASTAVIFAEAALLKAQTKVLNLRAKIDEERLQALIDAHLKSDDPEIRQHGVEMRQRQIEREAERDAKCLAAQSTAHSASANEAPGAPTTHLNFSGPAPNQDMVDEYESRAAEYDELAFELDARQRHETDAAQKAATAKSKDDALHIAAHYRDLAAKHRAVSGVARMK